MLLKLASRLCSSHAPFSVQSAFTFCLSSLTHFPEILSLSPRISLVDCIRASRAFRATAVRVVCVVCIIENKYIECSDFQRNQLHTSTPISLIPRQLFNVARLSHEKLERGWIYIHCIIPNYGSPQLSLASMI